MWFKFLLLIIITTFLYFPSIRYGFFQDDFLHLTTTQIPPTGLLKFFTDNSAIYYRPLGLQFAYWLQQQIFGPRPIYFHFVSFSIHLLNSFLVYSLITKVTKNKSVSFLASFLYATSAIHFMSLFWLAETNLLLGTLVLFLSLNFYLSRRFFLSLLIFIIGLFTHEVVIIFPALVFLLRRPPLTYLINLLFFSVIYLIFRLFIIPIPITGTYNLHLGSDTLSSFIWYGLWSLNLPEELKYQFVLSKLTFQPKFVTNFIPHLTIWLAGLLIILLLIFTRLLQLLRQSSHLLATGLLWFIAGTSLFLLLPLHQYPMYALAGLPGLTLILALAAPRRPLALIIFLLAWLVPAFVTLRFSELTHWTVQEARRVEDIFHRSQKQYSEFPPYSTLIIKTDYQLNQALFDQLGLQFLYQHPTLKTYYGDFHDLMPQECVIMEARQENIRPCLADHGLYLLD